MNLFCKQIHSVAKGYYIRNENLTPDRFLVVDISLRSDVILKYGNAVTKTIKEEKLIRTRGRNCQLARANNPSQQIFLTGWSIQSNIVILLACKQYKCEREAIIIVKEDSTMLQIQST